jgi:prophage antirepressor-like protein
MKELIKAFEGKKVRTIVIKREPWWVLADVCQVLNITNVGDAASRLDDDEKDDIGITDAIGRVQKTIIINESGLYTLILRSNKPEAKRFRKWVTSDVLPQIRKTGRYEISSETRKNSAQVRHTFTDTLKDHGVEGKQYIKITGTMKKHAGMPGNLKKDNMDKIELAKIEAAEMLATINMMQQDAEGYDEVKPICQEAAQAIAIATEKRRAIA